MQLYVIEKMHDCQVLHNCLSPQNILVGRTVDNHRLFLVDFKHSIKLVDNKNISIIQGPPIHNNFEPRGINEFSSLNNYLNIAPSKKDDLESVLYILLFLYRGGRLTDKISRDMQREKFIEEHCRWKSKSTVEEICKDTPPCFALFLYHIRSQNPNDRPEYGFLRHIFTKALHGVKANIPIANLLSFDLVDIVNEIKALAHNRMKTMTDIGSVGKPGSLMSERKNGGTLRTQTQNSLENQSLKQLYISDEMYEVTDIDEDLGEPESLEGKISEFNHRPGKEYFQLT